MMILLLKIGMVKLDCLGVFKFCSILGLLIEVLLMRSGFFSSLLYFVVFFFVRVISLVLLLLEVLIKLL